jgi:hypothetical protein
MASKFPDESKHSHRFSDIAAEPRKMLLPIEGYQNLPLVSVEKAVEPLHLILPGIEQKVWIAKMNCETPANGLSSDESASIYLYSMEWEPQENCLYFALNATLRDKNRQNLKPWFLYLKLILTALGRLPSTRLTVYRGVKLDLVNDYPEGKTFVWWGFSSCTALLKTLQSEQFLGKTGTRTLFAIECYSGKDIQQHSYFDTEKEVLLPAARQFKVKGCLDQGNGLHIIQLQETEPPFPLIELVPKVSVSMSFFYTQLESCF